ncbi:MAG TPA: hypothetical protein VFM93_09665 [Candidatus Limnocylindria bacterium]|nr:hypothetical protein [Candidatus Limnocylindria bacterium]
MKVLDPICDMVVDVAEARADGRTLVHDGREFAFCAVGCLRRFEKDPARWIPKVDAWQAHQASGEHEHPKEEATPAIDDGIRAWYKACRCCLSDTYPKVVEALDAEKERAAP